MSHDTSSRRRLSKAILRQISGNDLECSRDYSVGKMLLEHAIQMACAIHTLHT